MRKIVLLLTLCICFLSEANAQLSIGSMAPNIKLPDTAGKWRPLNEVKSKLILLDFWAVWCYPCVKSMPNVVKLYEKYHEQGLEVYAVSLDKGYYSWVNYIKEHNVPFIHVNDAYGFNGNSCKDYAISSIPNKILIKDGKILAVDMSLYDLEKIIQKELQP